MDIPTDLSKKACRRCKYFMRINAKEGNCIRFPPQAGSGTLMTQLGQQALKIIFTYPRIQQDLPACGEYVPKMETV